MFKQVGSLIREISQRSRSSPTIVALQVRQTAKAVLFDVCPDIDKELLGAVKVSTFKKGTLTVIAPSLLSSELKMRSGGLIEGINKLLGKKLVRELRFRSG